MSGVKDLQAGAELAPRLATLLEERYPLPAEVKARFELYEQAQRTRGERADAIDAELQQLAEEVKKARDDFFRWFAEQMPELKGKHVKLNVEDGTYQLFGLTAANEEKPE